jgi:LysM repeat protein
MRKFLLSALLASGLTLAAAGAYALDDQPQEPQTQEQMDQGTEIEQEAQDTGATQQSTTEESATEQSATEDQSQAEGEEYVVQEGDTLASIAKEKLGSEDRWQDIAEANGLENPDQLQVGQSLVIPSADEMESDKPTESEEIEQESSFDDGQSDKERFRKGTSEQNAPEEEGATQNY